MPRIGEILRGMGDRRYCQIFKLEDGRGAELHGYFGEDKARRDYERLSARARG